MAKLLNKTDISINLFLEIRNGGMNASQISNILEIDKSNVNKSLKKLEDIGFITSQGDKPKEYYHIKNAER